MLKKLTAVFAAFSMAVLAACTMATASPQWDLHRATITCEDASAPGFKLVAGSIQNFVPEGQLEKFSGCVTKTVHPVPAGVDIWDLADVQAWLASTEYQHVRPVVGQKYDCSLRPAERDPDAAGVPDREALGCYKDDGQPVTYGAEATDLNRGDRW